MSLKSLTYIALLFMSSGSVFAQDVNLFISEIKEERNSDPDDSKLEITASVNGIKIDEFNQVKIGKIEKAVDDLGNSLEKVESFFGDDFSSDSSIDITLEAPLRKATKIAELRGTLKQFSPSEANGSKIVIDRPLEKTNVNLLKDHYTDVSLMLVNKAEMDKLKAADEAAYKKELEKLKKEGGLEAGMAEAVDAFAGMFENMFDFGGSENELLFMVRDGRDQIIEVLVYNEKGEKMNYGSSQSGTSMSISLREAPTNDWSIELLIENEKALKELSFTLTNIILP